MQRVVAVAVGVGGAGLETAPQFLGKALNSPSTCWERPFGLVVVAAAGGDTLSWGLRGRDGIGWGLAVW